jgi:RNA polymerase sigma-70 factor (ECF subfamily)
VLSALEQERKIVEEAKQNPERFGDLYDKYFDQIYRYVYRRVGDKDQVYDLVSQTFYDALSHIKNYEWRGYSFSSWLYKIAHNNVLKYYRDQNKMRVVDLDDGRQVIDQSIDHVKSAKDNELKDEVQAVLDKLEPEEREIIKLKYFEEVSNIEIAEIMGLSANHIGVKVFRALKKFKQLINS